MECHLETPPTSLAPDVSLIEGAPLAVDGFFPPLKTFTFERIDDERRIDGRRRHPSQDGRDRHQTAVLPTRPAPPAARRPGALTV